MAWEMGVSHKRITVVLHGPLSHRSRLLDGGERQTSVTPARALRRASGMARHHLLQAINRVIKQTVLMHHAVHQTAVPSPVDGPVS